MNLSRFFTLEELCFSSTAQAHGIANLPTPAETESLKALCTAVLDPLREAVGRPIKVNSGYRGPALNKLVKGAANSQHLRGQAADLQCPGLAVVELFKRAIALQLPFDQIIYEVNGGSKWVHVSHAPGANKGQILVARFDAAGKVSYTAITPVQALAMADIATRSLGDAGEPGYVETADEPAPRAAPRGGAAVTKKVAAPKVGKTPAETAAKKAVPKKAVVRKAAPKKAIPNEAAAKKTVSTKTVPKQAAPKQTTPKKAVPDKPIPAKAARKTPATKRR